MTFFPLETYGYDMTEGSLGQTKTYKKITHKKKKKRRYRRGIIYRLPVVEANHHVYIVFFFSLYILVSFLLLLWIRFLLKKKRADCYFDCYATTPYRDLGVGSFFLSFLWFICFFSGSGAHCLANVLFSSIGVIWNAEFYFLFFVIFLVMVLLVLYAY